MKWTNLINCLEEYSEFIEEAVRANMPSYYELKKNIVFNLQINDTVFEIEFRAPDYWYFSNYGRGPGKFPPPSVIDSWIVRRKITPYPLRDGRVPTRPQLVYLISRKIAREGFKGSGFLEKGLKEQADYWEERIQDAVTKDIESEIMTWLDPVMGPTII